MNASNPEPSLRLAADCRIEFDPAFRPVAARAGRRVELGDHGLALLDRFREPATAREALNSIRSRFHGSQEWIECMRLVSRLETEGMLVDPAEADSARPISSGFASPPIHIKMLNDARRTEAFARAIRETITPDDTVLEIGTGSGILAATAAKAGARKVYAVEQTGIADAAERLFADNGVAGKTSLIRGSSTSIELPEPADVVIGELFGHDALEENVLESFLDAKRRHLKPGGRFLPRGVTIVAAPIRLAPDLRSRKRFAPDSLSGWKTAYQLDFSALAEWQEQSPDHFLTDRADLAQIQRCSRPVRFPAIAFDRLDTSIVEFEADVEIDSPGGIDGVILWFELDLADGVSLDTDPEKADAYHHWKSPVHLLASPLSAKAGDRVGIRYEYGRAAAPLATITRITPDA